MFSLSNKLKCCPFKYWFTGLTKKKKKHDKQKRRKPFAFPADVKRIYISTKLQTESIEPSQTVVSSLKTQLTCPIKVSKKLNIIPGAKTVRTKSAFLCKPERVTLTDSDGDRRTSEMHLAHLRSYKTVRVCLVSNHSARCSVGTVSLLPRKPERRKSCHPQITHHYSFCLPARFISVINEPFANKENAWPVY